MKVLLLSLTIIYYGTMGFSQNWQSVKSIDTSYYKYNVKDNLLATQIDSVDFNSGDSIFYPFKTLRVLENPFAIDGYNCSATVGDSWLGSKIVIKPNGDNLFFNNNNDTILIKTLANLGDSYTLYTYSNGNTIEATITAANLDVILGQSDSVKTFTLTSNEPSFYLINESFKIGKNTGLIQFIPFYSFPYQYNLPSLNSTPENNSEYVLVGKENPKTGITKPTYYDIYNLEIGDIIQYGEHGGPSHDYYEKEIIVKTLFSIDSVEYTIKRSHFYHSDGTSAQDPEFTSDVTVDTIQEKYNISNTYISSKIPEKLYFEHLIIPNIQWVDRSIFVNHSDDCGYSLTTHHSGYYSTYVQNDSVFYDNWHGADQKDFFISSAFSYYNSCFDPQDGGCSYSTNLISKNTTQYNCGATFYLGLNEKSTNTKLSIYPNPATNQITILTDINNIKIYSNLGQLVMEFEQPNQVIDVSQLTKGLYYIVVNDLENNVLTSKLIIE